MSGIFGTVVLSGEYKDALNKERMTTLLSKMAFCSQVRGKDATGIAAVGTDNIRTIKRGIAADFFVETKEYKDFLNSVNLATTHSIFGHCRAATKGSNKDASNNSPIVCGNVVGVHNGSIVNDDALFAAYIETFTRRAKVDCEIVFRLLDHLYGTLNQSFKQAIQRVDEVTNGTSAYACVSALAPSVMCLSRGAGNPLEVKLFEESGLVLFASSEHHLDEAAKVASMGEGEKISLTMGKSLLICAKHNEIAEVDLK
jgi:glucosamine 6-phosphate synthetase-like amidotransferase/phosphosugar isomerase protein